MTSDILDQFRSAFRAEAQDLLIELDAALLALEGAPGDPALVHRVFRAIHTIKGSGGTAGFQHLARFAHKIEEAFDRAREGTLAISAELIDCGLKACDVLRLILENSEEGAAIPGESEVTVAFTKLLPEPDRHAKPPAETHRPDARGRKIYEIVFKPRPSLFYSGADPVTVLDDLRSLGEAHVTGHTDLVPPLGSLQCEQSYLWWEIVFIGDCDPASIQGAFLFVEDECEVSIRLLENQAESLALLGAVPADAFELFRVECDEHLERIERDALALESNEGTYKDRLDSLFRSVHSIKGNAGLLLSQVPAGRLMESHPLHLLSRVAHALESLLDPFRAPHAPPTPAGIVQTALETCDAIRSLLGNLARGGFTAAVSPDLLNRLGIRTAGEGGAVRAAAFRNTASQCVEMIEGCLQRLEKGAEPPQTILPTYHRGLKTLSAAARYQNRADLEEPLAAQLRILADRMKSTDAELSATERGLLGQAFQSVRALLDMPPAERTPLAAKALPDRSPDRLEAAASPSTIRIDQAKLDRLLRVVGELLVARGAFPLLSQKLNAGAERGALAKDLKEAGSNISRIADELQSSVMSIRMLPVKTVFQRLPRLVRDVARSFGKEVRFDVEGEGIELDKTIVEQIGDPLVHLLRNAADHGLEGPEERLRSGKDRCGRLTLRAFYESGGVTIEVADDGRGLDAEALKRKAVEKGLLALDAAKVLQEEAAFQLIFLPGLSTAAKVTDVSGRGVGMDVVRSNVRNLGGSIGIRSRRGRGTTFSIRLPTSLMISKGILLEAGRQEYILPLSTIRDMVKLPIHEAHEYRGAVLAQVRGEVYPLFTLAELLGQGKAQGPRATTELSVAIVQSGRMKYGLVVDKFLTEVEVLVKPLTGGLERCTEFQGAAIMGDGRVVLVLNAEECHSLERAACG
jgi:two-component system chemotaxis sensor kinase CheA